MEFSKLIYWVQGVRKGCAPPSVCVQPRSLTHPPPPLACTPSPCAHPPWSFPLPLCAALPLACGIAWEEGTRGTLSLLRPPACRGGQGAGCVNQGAGRVNQGAQRGQPREWNDLHKGGG